MATALSSTTGRLGSAVSASAAWLKRSTSGAAAASTALPPAGLGMTSVNSAPMQKEEHRTIPAGEWSDQLAVPLEDSSSDTAGGL